MRAANETSVLASADGVRCASMQAQHGVVPGTSWGGMPAEQRDVWRQLDCDAVVRGERREGGAEPSERHVSRRADGVQRHHDDDDDRGRGRPSEGKLVEASSNTSLAAVWGEKPWQLKLARQAKQLKFYVYEPGDEHGWSAAALTSEHALCKTFQWSGDWELSQRFGASAQRTRDGDAADFYVVPFLSKCYYNFVAKYRLAEMDRAFAQVSKYLRRQGPWWEQRAERHVFFFMSGIGASIVPSWRKHLEPAVFVVAEGDRQADYFRYGHDIVVPGKLSVRPKRKQLSPASRELLLSFRGSLDATLRDAAGKRVHEKNKLRRWLADLLDEEEDVIYSGHKSARYIDEMDGARFCLIPRGNTPWTRRFFDAAVRGCIPVVLSDPVSFPFEQLIDYSRMTIKLPEQWAPRLAHELRERTNASAMAALQRRLHRAWPAFVYDGGCAFDFLLLELAARKHGYFARHPPVTPNTPQRFWSPSRGRFELSSAEKVGPSWGAGAVAH